MRLSRRTFLLAAGAVALDACGSSDRSTTKATLTTVAAAPKVTAAKPLVARVKIGAYVHETATQATPVPTAALEAFEAKLGHRFDIVHYFFGWGAPFAAAVTANVPTRELMISWDPPASAIATMHTGAQDAYVANYARAAKAYGHPVVIRLCPEMNGSWNAYSAAAAGGPSAAVFVLAWHRVVGIFRAVKATNVRFFWCPSETDSPDVAGNHLEEYWPGETYVDLLGFDGYNWSDQTPRRGSGGWRSFEQICAHPYARVTALAPKLEVWVGEIGCSERTAADPVGVSKGGWFYEMFRSTKFPRLGAVVYFSDDDVALKRDWRIDTSTASTAGWKRGWTS